jgi:hypothetical protein
MPQEGKNAQPVPASPSQIDVSEEATSQPISPEAAKSRLRAFWDFFVLFSGISTRSNLSRTRKDPIQSRGLFLFRKPRKQ